MPCKVARIASCSLLALVVGACGAEGRSSGQQPPTTTPPTTDPPAQGPPVVTPEDAVVYGHSATTLYKVDPDTLQVSPVGPFQWPNGADEMTDIALDGKGNMVGISYGAVYAVDKATAQCTYLAPFQGNDFNGLSFIYADVADGAEEQLVGASGDGTLYRVDPKTGQQTQLGSYGNGWVSSGDLVSVQGATYATVHGLFDTTDTLVAVDPATGKATAIGPTGVGTIWGLGYWKHKLFGFTENEGLVLIDVSTGKATPASNGSVSWYGAGVTTAAPTTVQ